MPDTGSIASGADRRITVRAQLPAGISGTGPFVATMLATSFGDSSVSDDKLEVLDEIVAPAVDLANSHSADLTNAGTDADVFNAAAPITTTEVAVGGVASFPLFVANNSGNSQSFAIGADLPAGWSVTFREVGVDTDADGTADNTSNAGNVVTAIPSLPAGAVFQYEAEVQVSSQVAQALSNFDGTVASSGLDGVDGNGDSDGDYPVRFTVVSSSDGSITDQKLDAVDVIANSNISVTPDGANQVQPGGNVDYTHVIANGGNTTEAVEITGVNSLAADGWNNNTQLFIDTTGNGTPDSWVQLGNLPTANDLAVRTPNGNTILVDIDNAGANPLVTLEPGQRLDVRVTVFAPSNAPAGTVDSYTLTASNANVSDSGTDTTEVVIGQVRLDKQAAIDAACDCAGGSWPAPGDFEPVQSNQVEPGQCVVWQLTATNEGATTAENVVITDETTEFTSFQLADDAVRASDSASTANTGTLPVVEWEVGQLVSGDSARTQFCVEVN